MSIKIKDRIDDALLLWDLKRYEGALLCVLIAFSATARLRYPDRKKISDKEAFERFYRDSSKATGNVNFKGEAQPVEGILYKWLRCSLVHEACVSPDVKFVQTGDEESGVLVVHEVNNADCALRMSHKWFNHLISLVTSAPENENIFKDFSYLSVTKINDDGKILF